MDFQNKNSIMTQKELNWNNIEPGTKLIWCSGFGFDYCEFIEYNEKYYFDNCDVKVKMLSGVTNWTQNIFPNHQLMLDTEENRILMQKRFKTWAKIIH